MEMFYEIYKVCNFYSPRKIILGLDVAKKVGEKAKALGAKRALIVTDPGIVSTGYVKTLDDSLRAAEIEAISL